MGTPGPTARASGHVLLPHTADVRISAWAPTEAGCLAEAVAGLVESFAEVPADVPTSRRRLLARAATPEERLVSVLEEVVYGLDADGVVPARTRIDTVAGDEVRGMTDVVPLKVTRPAGPAPKAITWHGLRVVHTAEGWRCDVVVDV